MNIWLGIYLLGCIFALIITIIELIELIKTHDVEDTEKQYRLIPVVIMLSWVLVCAWLYGYFYDKIVNIKNEKY